MQYQESMAAIRRGLRHASRVIVGGLRLYFETSSRRPII